jgi:hypothetical protein
MKKNTIDNKMPYFSLYSEANAEIGGAGKAS